MEDAINDRQGSGRGVKVALWVVSVVAVCSVGFGIYSIVQSTQKDSQISELRAQSEKDKNVVSSNISMASDTDEIDLAEVRNLLDDFITFDGIYAHGVNLFEDGLNEDYKYYLSLKKLDYSDKVGEMITGPNYEYTSYNFTYDDVNNTYHELFGSDSDVEKEQDGSWCQTPFFSTEYNKYISTRMCGGTYPVMFDYRILNYFTDDNDKLSVDVLYVYFDYGGGTLLLANGDKELVAGGANSLTSEYIMEYENELPKYRLTFEKNGSGYIFTDINKIQ